MTGWRSLFLTKPAFVPVPMGHYVMAPTVPMRTCSWCGAPVCLTRDTHITFCEECDALHPVIRPDERTA